MGTSAPCCCPPPWTTSRRPAPPSPTARSSSPSTARPSRPGPMAAEPDDHLAELRERLRQTQDAAERIAGRVPPQGWASPREGHDAAAEIQALLGVLGTLRDVVPEDLWEQVREIVRQLLLMLRAILDLI